MTMQNLTIPQTLIAPLEACRRGMEFHGSSLNLKNLSANTIWLSLTNRLAKPGNNDRGITFSERDNVWQVRFVNLLVAVAPRAAEARFLQLQFLYDAFGKVGLELDRISRLQPYIDGDIGYLPLADGRYAVIDAADFPECSQYTWRLNATYVQTKIKRRDVALYRLVFGPDLPARVKPVYHDGDRLNCRRANLNILNCSNAAASVRKTSKKTTSDYKGVSWIRDQCLWRAVVNKDGVTYPLGEFRSEWAAAKAYDERARELFGEHASVNFPRPGEQDAHRPKSADLEPRKLDLSLAA
jgi:hypothetical protein